MMRRDGVISLSVFLVFGAGIYLIWHFKTAGTQPDEMPPSVAVAVQTAAPPSPGEAQPPQTTQQTPPPLPTLAPPTAQQTEVVKKPPHTSERRTKKFQSGLYRFVKRCEVRARPKKSARVLASISKGKKLWVAEYNETWAKIFIKKRAAYVPKSCF